jgi:hypothetical protein
MFYEPRSYTIGVSIKRMVDTKPDAEELAETNRLSLDIEGVDLPANDDARQALLDRIEDEVNEIIEDEDLSANGARARTGHQYTQIPSHCPRCEHPLMIRQPVTLEDELPSETHASIFCSQCGYGGGAVYQLVDIQKNKYDAELGGEAYRSEVGDREIYPEYHSY